MSSNRKHSLVIRFGFTLSGIILLTFVSMLSSIFITESITGMGSAINQTGSLRMHSYQIATDLVYQASREGDIGEENSRALFDNYVHNFETRLHHQRIKQAIPKSPESKIRKAYQEVTRAWEYQIKPILYVYEKMGTPSSYPDNAYGSSEWKQLTEASRDHIRQRYMHLVSYFVSKIDALVIELEVKVEEQIKTLHIIESGSLFLASIIVVFAMISIHSNILSPLQSLMTATKKIREGDFSFKAIVHSNNELSELANTFNAMTDELSETYISQEQEIRHKTEDLKQKNSAMELLYNTSTILSQAPTSTESYEIILGRIKHFLNISSGLIGLSEANAKSGHILAITLQNHQCKMGCSDCHSIDSESNRFITYPIKDQNRSFGLLMLERGRDELEVWQDSTIRMISEQIGAAINIARSSIKEKESILNHERSSIARELHDSLAQSLTYLKIEVSRTQQEMEKSGVNEKTRKIVSDIRLELNNAYRQLRELLTTFRLSIETNELSETIQSAVKDFSQRGLFDIQTDIRLTDCKINPHEAIHLIYILREALNNIQKHASATHVWIELRSSPSRVISLTVQDDGVGIGRKKSRDGHFGLTLLEERTKALRGQYRISDRPGGGTPIEVSFTPVEYDTSTTQGNITSWINQIQPPS